MIFVRSDYFWHLPVIGYIFILIIIDTQGPASRECQAWPASPDSMEGFPMVIIGQLRVDIRLKMHLVNTPYGS